MTSLAESLIILIPCSPLGRWPFLPHMPRSTWSAAGMGADSFFSWLLPEPLHPYKILAALETCPQPSQASVLFSSLSILTPQEVFTSPQSHNFKYLPCPALKLHPYKSTCLLNRSFKFKTKVFISLPILSCLNLLLHHFCLILVNGHW